MTVQLVATGVAYATIPAWLYWEFTIWHRRKRGILPLQRVRKPRRSRQPQLAEEATGAALEATAELVEV